ncbi:hypothetical protein GCM10027426_21050 [Microbacterium lacusdiani]
MALSTRTRGRALIVDGGDSGRPLGPGLRGAVAQFLKWRVVRIQIEGERGTQLRESSVQPRSEPDELLTFGRMRESGRLIERSAAHR